MKAHPEASRPCAADVDHPIGVPTPEDGAEIAGVLARSFAGYPWTDWLVPATERPQRLRSLFEVTLAHVGIPHGEVRVAHCPESGRVVGAVVALRPDRPVPPEDLSAVTRHEEAVLGAHLEASRAAEATLERLRPTVPGLIIATVGVEPDHRRRGIAGRLLRPLLQLADDTALPTHLETSSADNLELYSRLGFAVTAEARIEDGPTVWLMTRAPQDRT